MYTSTGNAEALAKLALMAIAQGRTNVAFAAFFLLGRVDECLALLCRTNRFSEAALFASTYCPSRSSEIVKLWKGVCVCVCVCVRA